MYCWGNNEHGQLGRDTAPNTSDAKPAPVVGLTSATGASITDVTAGGRHSCALFSDSTIQCWGSNDDLQLGRTSEQQPFNAEPKPVENLFLKAGAKVTSISSGESYTCILISDDTVQCWGYNNASALGRPSETVIKSAEPKLADGLVFPAGVTIASLAVGAHHNCVHLSDNSVRCWGDNSYGELGQDPDTLEQSATAVFISGLSPGTGASLVSITSAWTHTCALFSDSIVMCWGQNDDNQLGRDDWVGGAFGIAVPTPAPVENLF